MSNIFSSKSHFVQPNVVCLAPAVPAVPTFCTPDEQHSFHFFRSEAVPTKLKDKVKTCSSLKEAGCKLDAEFGQTNVVALAVSKELARLQLKRGSEQSQFILDVA